MTSSGARILILALVTAAALATVWVLREPALRAAGWALVVDEPIEHADVIVVAADADGPGVLEAADLVHSGVAVQVAVFTDPPDGTDREFLRRGVPYEDRAAVSIRQLKALGVAAVAQIPRPVAGTQAEGQVLPDWCDQHRFHAVVVVSTRDHSRRLRRVLDRAMKGHRTKVMVRAARYSSFDPDRWWHTRDGVRTELIELQKLLLDVIRHPLALRRAFVTSARLSSTAASRGRRTHLRRVRGTGREAANIGNPSAHRRYPVPSPGIAGGASR